MKKFMKIQLAITIAFALCFTSCSKKNDTAPQQPNTKTLLTAKTWLVIKSANDDNKNGKLDDAEYYPVPANSPSFYIIMANGTVSENYNSGNSNVSATYSWELLDPQTVKLHNEALQFTEYWHIKTLTADQLNFEAYREDNTTLYFGDQCIPK